MSFWTAVVIIVAIGTISEVYRSKIKANASKSQEVFDTIAQRVARLEDRMANLETIVLEKEKAKKFSGLE
jgi:hypothetical protein